MKANLGLVDEHEGPSGRISVFQKKAATVNHLLLSRTQNVNRNLFAALSENDFLMSVPILNPVVAQVVEHHSECIGKARNAFLNSKLSNA